jgi:hypothetical protein
MGFGEGEMYLSIPEYRYWGQGWGWGVLCRYHGTLASTECGEFQEIFSQEIFFL